MEKKYLQIPYKQIDEWRLMLRKQPRAIEYQADAQQRLAWVEEGLKQRLIEDNSCPVCCANAGWQTYRL
jgi:hypothetical protein